MLEVDGSRGVAVLNMANRLYQGGGWLEGSSAQEEQLCYRSTLSCTLKPAYYPLPDIEPKKSNAISLVFSPQVAIFRTARPNYTLYSDLPHPRDPDIVSVLTVAANDLRSCDRNSPYDPVVREIMRDKIRLLLRVAALRGQTRLVLGAFGCGAFLNPPEEVARLFSDVFDEREFEGGWWREIVFAILPDGPNVPIFEKILAGKVV
jgi:uncharacterized protein (TIGR02452 family)